MNLLYRLLHTILHMVCLLYNIDMQVCLVYDHILCVICHIVLYAEGEKFDKYITECFGKGVSFTGVDPECTQVIEIGVRMNGVEKTPNDLVYIIQLIIYIDMWMLIGI